MSGRLVGYARVSGTTRDRVGQREGLAALGVPPRVCFLDEGPQERSQLRQAHGACEPGDTLVVTRLSRLARSLPDAHELVGELADRGVRLSIGGCIYDSANLPGQRLSDVLAMVIEFEADLIRERTPAARVRRRLEGGPPVRITRGVAVRFVDRKLHFGPTRGMWPLIDVEISDGLARVRLFRTTVELENFQPVEIDIGTYPLDRREVHHLLRFDALLSPVENRALGEVELTVRRTRRFREITGALERAGFTLTEPAT